MWNRRILSVCVAALIAFSPLFAGEKADAVWAKYKTVEDCTTFSMSGPLARMAISSSGAKIPKGSKISGINVLGFEKEKFADTQSYWTDIDRDLKKSMELALDARHEGDHIKIYMEPQGEDITSLVMFVMDRSQNVFAVILSGRMAKADARRIIEESKKK